MSFERTDGRAPDELRPARITPGFLPYAEGSVLIEMGNTRVVCSASLEDRVPPFLRNSGQGWLTAEYAMLPRATQTRTGREIGRGGPSGRTHEIQRLIGRSLRAVADMKALANARSRSTATFCKPMAAHAPPRLPALTSRSRSRVVSCSRSAKITRSLTTNQVAAVSVGIVGNTPLLDLKYDEDSSAEVDMNIVCTGDGRFIELQGTAEREPFSRAQMDEIGGARSEWNRSADRDAEGRDC